MRTALVKCINITIFMVEFSERSLKCGAAVTWGQSYWSPPFSLHASPVTAANCILTDYQRGAVNHQPRELQGKRVRGCFQQTEMEKMMKSKSRQRGGGGGE